jgi:hypothetical protein
MKSTTFSDSPLVNILSDAYAVIVYHMIDASCDQIRFGRKLWYLTPPGTKYILVENFKNVDLMACRTQAAMSTRMPILSNGVIWRIVSRAGAQVYPTLALSSRRKVTWCLSPGTGATR